MRTFAVLLLALALLATAALPADALHARGNRYAAPAVEAPGPAATPLALLATLADTLARILLHGDPARLTTIERDDAEPEPLPLPLRHAVDFLRRG